MDGARDDGATPTRVERPMPAVGATPLPAPDLASRHWTCPTCHALYRPGMTHCPRDGARLDEATSDPLVGQTFAGRYVIEAMLGEGGMGRVYRARHTRMRRRFAIKVLHAELSLDDKMVIRFHREATAISRLSHHNVVGIVDFGELESGLLYLVMEYVEGGSLRALMRREGALASDRVLTLLDQLCDGLAHAHRHGLVHRDFKPDNVLIEPTDDGVHARIVDFGIAADVAEHRITTDGLVLGTPHYMAPEQTVGHRLDQRSDLYALGVVLYEMIAGALPFAGPPALVAQMHALMPAPPVAERAPGVVVDPLLEALALRLMAKRPEERLSSAQEVRRLVKLARHDRAAALAALGVAPRPDSDLKTLPAARPPAIEPRAERALAVAPAPRGQAPPHLPRRRGRVAWPWLVAAAAAPGLLFGALQLGPAPGGATATAALAAATAPVARGDAISIVELPPAPVPPRAEPPPMPTTTASPPAPTTGVAAVETPTAAPRRRAPRSLTQRYRALGKRLDRLVARRGARATADLRARYLAIPIADALRDPSQAPRVSRQITAVRRAVDRALR
jgi:tRNA A-37 threonylcarbamoyl transferase component Bud32